MEPIEYLRILRRRWPIVAACLAVAIVAAWITTPSQSKRGPVYHSYSATATLLRTLDSSSPSGSGGQSLPVIKLLATTGDVPRMAAQRLHYKGDPALLATRILASYDQNIGSLAITAHGSDGAQTAATANAFADATLEYLRQLNLKTVSDQLATDQQQLNALSSEIARLDQQIGAQPDAHQLLTARRDAELTRYQFLYQNFQQLSSQGANPVDLVLLQRATPIPVVSGGFQPPASRLGRVGLAALLGMLLGIAGALVVERVDTRLRTRVRVETAFGLPVLSEIPHLTRSERDLRPVVLDAKPDGPAAESYRVLRSSLLLMLGPHRLRPNREPESHSMLFTRQAANHRVAQVVLITSARAGEGKTTTAASLCSSLAEVGYEVLALDCDLRHPELHRYLDVPAGQGLSNLLSTQAADDLEPLRRPTMLPGVTMVTCGTSLDHPAAIVARMGQVLRRARALADYIVIDSPPLLSANDAIDLLPHVDAVLVACKSGRTNAEQAGRVTELLRRSEVQTSGVVLVGARHRTVSDDYRYVGWQARGRRARTESRHGSESEADPSEVVIRRDPAVRGGLYYPGYES